MPNIVQNVLGVHPLVMIDDLGCCFFFAFFLYFSFSGSLSAVDEEYQCGGCKSEYYTIFGAFVVHLWSRHKRFIRYLFMIVLFVIFHVHEIPSSTLHSLFLSVMLLCFPFLFKNSVFPLSTISSSSYTPPHLCHIHNRQLLNSLSYLYISLRTIFPLRMRLSAYSAKPSWNPATTS